MYTELFHSEYMFLFDNTDESYYNLSLSLLVNVIPIFNKKYEEFITQCGILIDDNNNVEHLLETINNSQIKENYLNNCQKYSHQHGKIDIINKWCSKFT